MHTKFCLCPPILESLFPLVLWKSCSQFPLAFKPRFPGDSQSLCQIPSLGSLMWDPKHSQQLGNIFGINVLLLVSHPSSGYEIWFYHDSALPLPTISLWFLLCLWMWDIFFLGGGCSSGILLSIIVQQLVANLFSPRRRWACVLLLCHLEPEVSLFVLSIAEKQFRVWIYHSLLIHFPTD